MFFLVAFAATAAAETPQRRLVVGTKEAPPFAYRDASGEWSGIAIALWKEIAGRLDVEYEFREVPLSAMFDRLARGELDAAVAAISITPKREERIDFSHPYFHTGLGIAVRTGRAGGFWPILGRLLTTGLFKILGLLALLVLLTSVLFYWLERRRNEKIFGGPRRRALGEGLWWAVVLLLGKVVHPQTLLGRVLAVVAMVISALAVSALTGAMASALTVRELETQIDQVEDLRGLRTAAVAETTSAEALRARRISYRAFPSVERALRALVDREIDTVVYDAAMLRYLAEQDYSQRVDILPIEFEPQEYGIALPAGSELREPVNRALLRFKATDRWKQLVFRHIGE